MDPDHYSDTLPGSAAFPDPMLRQPGLLIIADGDVSPTVEGQDGRPVDDARQIAAAAGMRLQGLVPVALAAARLDTQVDYDVVMVRCERADPVLERLLVQLETLAGLGELALIVVAGRDALDLAFATMRSGKTELLCEPDMADLAAALVAAASRPRQTQSVHDISRESDRLSELSAEVARLARTLDSLTGARRHARPAVPHGPRVFDRSSDYIGMPELAPMDGSQPSSPLDDMSSALVRDLLRARRMRAQFLPGDLFADPAWDMMLDLLAARLDGERVSVSSLCIASAVPPTTALRWIRTLTDQALVERHADPLDGRRVFIQLADQAAEGLARWFASSRRLLAGALG
jgi:DNA-binding transcriptional ArsR family regulator